MGNNIYKEAFELLIENGCSLSISTKEEEKEIIEKLRESKMEEIKNVTI